MAIVELCTFIVGGRTYGIDVTAVQEVLEPRPITAVPLSAPSVAGVISLRGQLLPALDLRRMLGMAPASQRDEPSMHLVVHGASGNVSLLIDAAGDVVVCDRFRAEPPPAYLSGPGAGFVTGTYPRDGDVLVVLDHRLLTRPMAA